MQALKSARFLNLKEEAQYPERFKSPNPALSARKGRAYDKDFLLQFQKVFQEKPSVDWDLKVKETLGPGDDSARTPSARSSSMASRQPSGRPGAPGGFPGGVMGQFAGSGPRTLPPGTTSQQRFEAAQTGSRPAGMPGMGGRIPSNLGPAGMSRTNSLQQMGGMGAMGPGSPRTASSRGGARGGGSKRGDRAMSKKEEADMAAKMPLTAHMDIKGLEKSQTGWKPTSIGQSPMATSVDPNVLMAPDVVQRKVKAALNKMTPEKFDKISDQILEIAGQSKHESDGRTLRQVIQLTFEKACDEAHWAGMYAKFCHKMLTTMSTDIRDENVKDKNGNPVVGGALFRKYLLNRCQEEFERGWQVNLPEQPEGDSKEAALLSDEYYVAAAAKRRGLGLIQFIGQLYKLRMLTLRIMHECVMKLLNFEGDPDEAAVENLTTLLKTVGATMNEEEQGRALIQSYFDRIDAVLLKSEALGSRPKFMIMDMIDLRKAGWKGKDDTKGPKTIEQIHQEAAEAQAKAEAERARSQRGGGGRPPAGRGDARNFSGPPAPVDYSAGQVRMDDLRRLQQRGASNRGTGSLGPGGGLGPSALGGRAGSRRGLGPPSSGNTTRTNTPPVDKEKKEEPSTAQNAFSALASLDQSGDADDMHSEQASPPAARNRSKSPAAEKAEEAS
ncbi:ARM repeat-containing protein [Teratosphaeria nubilosa]|uniref:ARM repeat-containing protein n=1 Tax=Teratosphaeria nubilosa TaxID=161662 RepID=A0A6G1L040_9PEZI|nr:ARM repeat-containing protein [Teratosphaeria nubilosa]